MYQNILIPLENSKTDQVILKHIRPLAKMTGARLLLVHVADGFVARNQKRLNLSESEEMQTDRLYLERCANGLSQDGFSVSYQLLCGEPAHEILELAKRTQCDLIAMATHGHRLIGDIILGSVADELRHESQIPILMVREQDSL